jgi:2,4-dienoyl-CoA reductase-like NADH-dependent reductase (Old Yellow Enzyme family)
MGEPFALTASVRLRNRFVAVAHGSGAVVDGLPVAGDAEYWQRVAAGGASMVIGGGAVVAAEATARRGNVIALHRREAIAPLRRRHDLIRQAGAVPVIQLLHLGRETLGAETFYAPIAPSAVRSPREPTAPRALTHAELDALVDQFRLAAANALEAGAGGFELHAAHGYLLGQFLSPVVNRRAGAETLAGRTAFVWRIVDAVRELDARCPIGIRISIGQPEDAGLDVDAVCELLGALHSELAWVNATVDMRHRYVRDMATERPPLLDALPRLRAATGIPLLVAQSFRDRADVEAALDAGADLVGFARGLIADSQLPRKLLDGEDELVRPCVACNEDCRLFEPVLLCTVNPGLAPPGELERPARPLVRGPEPAATPRRVAVIGAGPAGLECALILGAGADVTVYERADRLGGALALAAAAPHRRGWQRLLDYYGNGLARHGVELLLGTEPDATTLAEYDAIVVATGSDELAHPQLPGALTVSQALAAGPDALAGIAHLVVVDDGFGWWPGVSAIELGVAAGAGAITVVTPGTAFAAGIPPESRAQLLPRLRGVRLTIRPLTTATDGALDADAVIAVGERVPRAHDVPEGLPAIVVGDAIVPRRVAHAIAEGRAAARRLVAPVDRAPAGAPA